MVPRAALSGYCGFLWRSLSQERSEARKFYSAPGNGILGASTGNAVLEICDTLQGRVLLVDNVLSVQSFFFSFLERKC